MSLIDSQYSRQGFWENHVHAWQASGLSKARYCREHDLIYHQIIYWVSKISSAVRSRIATSESPKFLPVAIQHPQALPAELQIRLPNGATISGISAESVELVGTLMAQL